MASPGGARDGDITCELIRSKSFNQEWHEKKGGKRRCLSTEKGNTGSNHLLLVNCKYGLPQKPHRTFVKKSFRLG